MRTLVSSGADADLRSLRGISATDLGGVLAPHSWALHTQARILGDQYYLSPTDIDSNYPPLGQMLQTELYMEEAQSMVANRSWPSAVARASAGHVDAQADAVDAQADVQADAVEVQMATLQSMLAETDEAVAANARARAALERQREVERASDMAALHEQDARRQAKSAEMRAEQAARSASLLARIEERAGGVYNARMDTLHDETAAEGARRAAAAAAAAEEASAEAVRAAAAAEAAEMAAASTSDGVVNACHVVTHVFVCACACPVSEPTARGGGACRVFSQGGAADRGGADDVSDRTSPLRMSPARMRTSPVVPEEPEVTGPVLVKGDMVTLARDAPGFFTLRCASCGGFARSFSTEILQCDARVFSSRKPREKWLAQSRSERAGRGGLAGSR